MLLSRLVYEAVKATKMLDDPEFTYEAFRTGFYDAERDYSAEIANAMGPINEAVARLSDGGKIPLRTEWNLPVGKDGFCDTRPASGQLAEHPAREIECAFVRKRDGYSSLPYRYGPGWLIVLGPHPDLVGIQYREDIRRFSSDDWDYRDGADKDVELDDYGLNNASCAYIAEYAAAQLFRTVDPSMASDRLARAELCFSGLPEAEAPLFQHRVAARARYF